jgi:uncharacterized protein DUF2867
MRIDPAEYRAVDARAHTLLADVPLHDVWAVDLASDRPGLTVLDVQAAIAAKDLKAATPAVKLLFRIRGRLGRAFGWDRGRDQPPRDSFVSRLSPAERDASLMVPGAREGSRWTLLVTPREHLSELQNATVHAVSAIVMVPRPRGYRVYWAIYVRPVGRITAWYLRLIDPFRRLIIYPAVLREVRRAWDRAQGVPTPVVSA